MNTEQDQKPETAKTAKVLEPSLREQLKGRLEHAESESRKAELLRELIWLMDEHPPVARMIELLHLLQ